MRILVALIVVSLTQTASAQEKNSAGEAKGKPPIGNPPLKINPTPDQTCALNKILETAKAMAKFKYADRPRSNGLGPMAIREVLEHLGVEVGSNEGRRNAIDYVRMLPKDDKFTATGITNLEDVPSGGIVVYSGPSSEAYLRDGTIASNTTRTQKGDSIGDIMIKGDDNKYYADGKKDYPAIRGRTIAGVFIPGPKLAKEICNKKIEPYKKQSEQPQE